MKRHEMRRLLNAKAGDPGIVVPGAEQGGDNIRHVCPECGGPTALHLGAHLAVGLCWACGGTGYLFNDELAGYQSRLNARAMRKE